MKNKHIKKNLDGEDTSNDAFDRKEFNEKLDEIILDYLLEEFLLEYGITTKLDGLI